MADPGKMSNEKALKLAATLEDIDDEANPGLREKILKTLSDHGFPQTTDAQDTGFGGARIVDPGLEQEPNAAVQPKARKMGTGEAVGLGAMQGITLDFADEAEAWGGSQAGEIPRTTGRTIDAELDPRTPFEALHDDLESRLALARQEQPGAFMIGEMGGGAVPGLVAGQIAMTRKLVTVGEKARDARRAYQIKKAKSAERVFKERIGGTLAEGAAVGAGLGAVTGLGMSDFDQGAWGVAKDVAVQGGMGIAGGLMSGAAAEALSEIPRYVGRRAHASLTSQRTNQAQALEYRVAEEAGGFPQVLGAPQGMNHGEAIESALKRAQAEARHSLDITEDDIAGHVLPRLRQEYVDWVENAKAVKQGYYDDVGGGAPINVQVIADEIQILKQAAEEGMFSEASVKKLKPLYESLFKKGAPGEAVGTAAENAVAAQRKFTGFELSPSAAAASSKAAAAAAASKPRPRGPAVIREIEIKPFDDSIDELKLLIKDSTYEAGMQKKLTTIRDAMLKLRKRTHRRHHDNMVGLEGSYTALEEKVSALGMVLPSKPEDFIKGKNPIERDQLINAVQTHGTPRNSAKRSSRELNDMAQNDPVLRRMLNTNAGMTALEAIESRTQMGLPGKAVARPGGLSGYISLSPGDQLKARVAGLKSATGAGASRLGGRLAASIDRDMVAAMTEEQKKNFRSWVINAQADGRDLNPDDFERGMRQ